MDGKAESAPTKLPFACDMVMKGGITSGVVYPTAVVELAKDHRIYNVGGSSAGAIAAVLTAAAEYGRQSGGSDGFGILGTIPDALAAQAAPNGPTLLQRLFVPQRETGELFHLYFDLKKTGSCCAKACRIWATLNRNRGLSWSDALAVVVVLLFAGLAICQPSVASVLLVVVVAAVALAAAVVIRAIHGAKGLAIETVSAVESNFNGLVNGSSVGEGDDAQVGLTNWLHDRIQEAAGREPSDPPLAYGDLWDHDIGLVTLTTNLSQTSSETFPFGDETWAFKPKDFETLFPTSVASHLVLLGTAATAAASTSASTRAALEAKGLLKLPPARQLPILMGARVSLSFPVLISAVPLWRYVPVQFEGEWVMAYRQVWLSDGGICSNMPVHLFDKALPTRPTYGISLAPGAEPVPATKDPDELMRYAHRNIRRPILAGSGANTPVSPITSVTGFLSSVANTMQNWSDTSASLQLGARDRVCTVQLGEDEGGMNLDMQSATITHLAERGKAAGENLGWMVRGAPPSHAPPLSEAEADVAGVQWTRHRWARLRSASLALQRYLEQIGDSWAYREPTPQHAPGTEPDTRSYLKLASEEPSTGGPTLPYASGWTNSDRASLLAAMTALVNTPFGSANEGAGPPFRRLVLSSRREPEGVIGLQPAPGAAGVTDTL